MGTERFKTSLKNFGLAGNVVCNTDMVLIDGNSRLVEAKEKGLKKIWVSLPSRKLGPQEFLEMSSLFDFAKSGDVDIERVEKEIFKTKDIYAKWGMPVPMELLNGMGANAKIKPKDFPGGADVVVEEVDLKMVQLFFSTKEEIEFRRIEEVLKKRLRTDNTTELVLKVFRKFEKQ